MTKENITITNINEKNDYSNIVPIWKFVLLSLLSFNFYPYYWFYKKWIFVKQNTNISINPLLRTVAILVPILNFVLIYSLFNKINSFADEDNKISVPPLLIAVIFFGCLGLLNRPYQLFTIFSFLPLIFLQKIINEYFKYNKHTVMENNNFNWIEYLCLVAGLFNWYMLFKMYFNLV